MLLVSSHKIYIDFVNNPRIVVCEFNCSPNFHERLVASVYLHSRAIQSLVFVPPSLIIRTETSCRTSPMSAQQGKILGFQTIKVLCSVDKL